MNKQEFIEDRKSYYMRLNSMDGRVCTPTLAFALMFICSFFIVPFVLTIFGKFDFFNFL
jgi:hypothetical protein